MANYVLPITATSRRGLPSWTDKALNNGHKMSIGPSATLSMTKEGFVWISEPGLYWGYVPVIGDLPVNNFEALMEFDRVYTGDESGSISGGSLFFGTSKTNMASRGIAFSIGSGNISQASIVHHNQNSNDTTNLASASVAGLNAVYTKTYIRARVVGSTVSIKVWINSLDEEPTSWLNTYSISALGLNLKNIGIINAGRRLAIRVKRIAYATNGDTASLLLPPVVRVVSGSVTNSRAGDIVVVRELDTHDVVFSTSISEIGRWSVNLYDNKPVYARIEKASGSEYDLIFARYSNGYLGGDAPDGIIKDDGVPTEANIKAVYRSNDPILGGVVIDQTTSKQSGEWRISGLNQSVPMDIIASKLNRNNKIVSNVNAVLDENQTFLLDGAVGYSNLYMIGSISILGSVPPVTVSFTGDTPLGLNPNNHVSIASDSITINYPMRDYGDFSFGMTVTDATGFSASKDIGFLEAKRAPFVDFVMTVNSQDTGSSPAFLTIPSTVQPNDVLVLCVMRRGDATVSDNNGGVWTLAADSYPASGFFQASSIYWRIATASDIGKVVKVSSPTSSRLIAYLSAYRGKYANLTVVEGVGLTPGYDTGTSSTTKLEPVTHDGGFMVRSVSSPISTDMVINGMTNTGPLRGAPLRHQVGYIHLPAPGLLDGISYYTGQNNSSYTVPDAYVIIDEIRL